MSRNDSAFLAEQYPEFKLRGLADRDLDEMLDAWFAHDHYDNTSRYVNYSKLNASDKAKVFAANARRVYPHASRWLKS